MYLYSYIFIGALMFSIYSFESTSNHAVSSQNYDRGDVSLSYKYNFSHIYSTSKPYNYSNYNPKTKYQDKKLTHKLPRLVNYQNLQYAPLPLKTQESQQYSSQVFNSHQEVQKTELHTEVNTPVFNNEIIEEIDSQQEQKSNVVTRNTPSKLSNHPRTYVPGYNVDLQAVHNKLTQNGLYASNPNFLIKNKQVHVNYLQPPTTLKKKDQNHLGISQEANAKGGYSVLTYQYYEDIKKYDGIEREHIAKQPFFYVKAPNVELNIARSHEIAHPQHKASVNVNSSFRKLPSLPQEFFSNPKISKSSKFLSYSEPNSKGYSSS